MACDSRAARKAALLSFMFPLSLLPLYNGEQKVCEDN